MKSQTRKMFYIRYLGEYYGGEGGIRTPDTVARMPHFECGAFNHSATSPSGAECGETPRRGRSISEGGRSKQALGRGLAAPRANSAAWRRSRVTPSRLSRSAGW